MQAMKHNDVNLAEHLDTFISKRFLTPNIFKLSHNVSKIDFILLTFD